MTSSICDIKESGDTIVSVNDMAPIDMEGNSSLIYCINTNNSVIRKTIGNINLRKY